VDGHHRSRTRISVAQDLASGDVSTLIGHPVQFNGQAFTVIESSPARAIPANRTSTTSARTAERCTGRALRLQPTRHGQLTAIAVLAAPGRIGPHSSR